MTESVTRYVATYVNRDGMRTLMGAQQGRNTYATAEEAQNWINDVTGFNSTETIKQHYGDNPRFEVRPCPCWPVHFDPQTCWFDTKYAVPPGLPVVLTDPPPFGEGKNYKPKP